MIPASSVLQNILPKSPLFCRDIDTESNEATLRSIEQAFSDQRHSLGGYERGFNSKTELKGAFDFKNRMNQIFGGLSMQDSDTSRMILGKIKQATQQQNSSKISKHHSSNTNQGSNLKQRHFREDSPSWSSRQTNNNDDIKHNFQGSPSKTPLQLAPLVGRDTQVSQNN